MILIIRIAGLVETDKKINEFLFRLRLRKKYTAILVKDGEETRKVLRQIRDFVAYGPINKETLHLLLSKRGKSIDKKKIDVEKIIDEVEKKNLSVLGLKPYFRLHPPRGGIESKVHFPIRKGVLGDNKEKINDLARRML